MLGLSHNLGILCNEIYEMWLHRVFYISSLIQDATKNLNDKTALLKIGCK